MARTYKRDSRGRFAGGGGGGGGGGKSRPAPRQIQRGVNRLTRDNAGRITSVGGSGATARGGRLRTAAGNKRAKQTAIIKSAESKQAGRDLLKASQKSFKVNAPTKFGGENQLYATPRGKAAEQGRVAAFRNLKAAQRRSGLPSSGGAMRVKGGIKRDPNVAAKLAARTPTAKPSTRKEQLAAGAQRRNAQADRIDAKVKALETEYRSKDAAFYTQGVKPAGRDRMYAKMEQAQKLREESAALRTKAANAERMSKQTKGTAASKKQERRNAFDAAGYKVGDTVTTAQFGTQKITKISKNSVSFDKGNSQDKAFMALYLGIGANQAAKPAPTASTGARLGGTRRTMRAAAPRNTTPNRTGQAKTLNRFNSRPVGTMVAGKGINLEPSTKRVPLRITEKESDRAFARVATKAARARARSRAAAPAKAQQKQVAARRAARVAANQKRVTQVVLAKGGRRPTPTKKQRRSILTAEAAKRFYATKAVDTLKVNVKKPGFRLPRGMR